MPHILKPDIPDSQYFEIVKFVTHCIAGSPEEVVGGKQLTQSYLEQYLDKNRLEDEVYVTTEKRLIIQTIRYMASVSYAFLLSASVSHLKPRRIY